MIDRRSPSDKILSRDAHTIVDAARGEVEVALILGSGLSDAVVDAFSFTRIPYDHLLGMPVAPIPGHLSEALVGTWHGKRVVAFGGRVHLYQGFSAQQVTTPIRLANAAGARTVILTNAAGALNPEFAPGDLMLIADHLNLTGLNPLVAAQGIDPFISMHDAYSPRLRERTRAVAGTNVPLREGVYAGLVGPSYETPAEARMLRMLGADAVGMSTVLETIAARARGMEVLGVSVIANAAGDAALSHHDVTAVSKTAAARLRILLDGLLAAL
jgi:purine-nucleoside phosphorylase